MYTLTDVDRLAETLHHMLDMDEDAARGVLREYIRQIEELDGRDLDEDALSEEDAEFLIKAVKSARLAGDLGQRELAELEDIASEWRDAHDMAEALRDQRDRAICAALDAGAAAGTVARAAGVSRSLVVRIGKARGR